ncbi:MAG: amidohydrolase family protein [Pyrinomonadaceae bacterium]
MFDEDEMLLYLANGVTTVRNMHGTRTHLEWREQIRKGERLGPRLFTAGPILDGDPPTRNTNVVVKTKAEAENAVAEQKQAGYDFIKIYDNVPRDIYEAITAVARRHNIPVTGHIPSPVGVKGLPEVPGQVCVEHVEELLPFLDDGRDPGRVDEIAKSLAQAGIWVDPTLTVFLSAYEQVTEWPLIQKRPEMKYVNSETMRNWGWAATAQARFENPRARERFQRVNLFFEQKLIPALHRAGVRLLVGTDAPMATIPPGFAMLGELRALVRSGLTPYEALVAATRNPAEFMNQSKEFGTIEIGKRADLILLSTTPLENINAVENKVGVMANGRWLSMVELQQQLENLSTKYAKATPEGSEEK